MIGNESSSFMLLGMDSMDPTWIFNGSVEIANICKVLKGGGYKFLVHSK